MTSRPRRWPIEPTDDWEQVELLWVPERRGIELGEDPEAEALLERFGTKSSEAPVALWQGKDVLKNPADAELARIIGLELDAPRDRTYDLAVVGTGPAGLGASVGQASLLRGGGGLHGCEVGASTPKRFQRARTARRDKRSPGNHMRVGLPRVDRQEAGGDDSVARTSG